MVAGACVGVESTNSSSCCILDSDVATPSTSAHRNLHRTFHFDGGREVAQSVLVAVKLACNNGIGRSIIGRHTGKSTVVVHLQPVSATFTISKETSIGEVGLDVAEV